MPRTKISEFSATPASNTDIDSINISEGCAPSGINDAIRELMAQLKDFQTGAVGDSFNGPVGTTTAAAGAFTTLSSTGNTTLGDASGDSVTINGTATFANANPTLSAGTANGVAYLNGSKVVTSGSALTFDGTNFANTGNITAGTTGSGANLVAYASTYTSNGMVRLFGTDGNNKVEFGAASATTAFLTARAGVSMIFGANDAEQMRLTSTGLGIGTSSPSQLLTVKKDQAAYTWSRIDNQSSSASAYSGVQLGAFGNTWGLAIGSSAANSNALTFLLDAGGANSEKMQLDTSGNLGLGVTPSAWNSGYKAFESLWGALSFDIAYSGGTVLGANCYLGTASSSDWRYKNTAGATRYYQRDSKHEWYTAPSGTAGNAITFTQVATIDASGNFLVGTTSFSYNPTKGATISGGSVGVIGIGHASGTADGNGYLNFAYNGTNIGSVTQNSTTSVAYNTSSDYRLKNITGPITNSGAYIDSLNPVEGTWKADGSTFVGLIAHEVQEASRTPVATGTKDGAEMQAMDYSNSELIANLIAEVKSLRKRLANAGL